MLRKLVGFILIVSMATAGADALSLGQLPAAQNVHQAAAVVMKAEKIPVALYFAKGANAAAVQAFNKDFLTVASANHLIGAAEHLDGFQTWWASHAVSILSDRSTYEAHSLQQFFSETLIVFEIDRAQALKDPSAFMNWLADRVTNPVIRQVSSSALLVSASVFSFASGILYGAVVAGPVAGSVGAFLEPVVRPLREKVGVLGSRWLGGLGVRLNARLYAEKGNAQAVDAELTDQQETLQSAKKSVAATRELMRTMSLDMTPSQYAQNVNHMHEVWNETNQAWAKIHPAIFKDGRALVWEALYFRPQSFSTTVMQSLTSSEVFRQGLEQTVDRIAMSSPAGRAAVEASARRLMDAVDKSQATGAAPETASAVDAARAELISLGASDEQARRIEANRTRELLFAKQTATTLATMVLHDFHFEEFNRSLPEMVSETYRVFRAGFCMDYFQHEFAAEVAKILDAVEFKVKLAEKTLESAAAASEAAAPKVQEKRPEEKPAPTPKARLRDRALRALGRLNHAGHNAAAIERVVEPIDERAAKSERAVRIPKARK